MVGVVLYTVCGDGVVVVRVLYCTQCVVMVWL